MDSKLPKMTILKTQNVDEQDFTENPSVRCQHATNLSAAFDRFAEVIYIVIKSQSWQNHFEIHSPHYIYAFSRSF